MSEPSLTKLVPEDSRGIVLVLHGGLRKSTLPVIRFSPTWRRGRRLAGDLREALSEEGVGLAVLRNAVEGWNAGNAAGPAAVLDARWAVARLRDEAPGIPVVLLGHGMGARAAVAAADSANVVGVLALAPWFPSGEPVSTLAGKTLRAAHGDNDHLTSAADTKALVERAAAAGADATFTDLGSAGHFLMRGVQRWNAFALEQSLSLLATASARPTRD